MRELHKELLLNKHGEEIFYLKQISIFPNKPLNTEIHGLYEGYWYKVKDGIHMYKKGIIYLFDGDYIYDTCGFSRTISHEYGHHFTLYYLWTREGKTFFNNGKWELSNYYKARKLQNYPLVLGNSRNGYQWAIYEIAAEDYVQLYGSPNVYQVKKFYDVHERLIYRRNNESIKMKDFNVFPQYNFNLPLAQEIPTVKQYWDGLSGWATSHDDQKIIPNINLTCSNHGIYRKEFDIHYNKELKSHEWLFTLVAYKNGQRYPIRTFNLNSTKSYFGSIKCHEKVGDPLYFQSGKVLFRVYAINLNSNLAISSNTIKIDFNLN